CRPPFVFSSQWQAVAYTLSQRVFAGTGDCYRRTGLASELAAARRSVVVLDQRNLRPATLEPVLSNQTPMSGAATTKHALRPPWLLCPSPTLDELPERSAGCD